MNMTVPILLKIASRMSLRRVRGVSPDLYVRMHDHKCELRQLRMQIRQLLPSIKQVVQNYYLIVGRNTLLCDEQKDRMQGWKQNLNLVSRGYGKLLAQLDLTQVSGSSLGERLHVHMPASKLVRMLMQLREIKVELKKLRILSVSYDIQAVGKARQLHDFLHSYHAYRSGVRDVFMMLRIVYQNACRENLPYVGKASTMVKLERKRISSDLARDLILVDRCLHFIQSSRVSREHNYQAWSLSTPSPVLPAYVRKAVERHREKYGSQSIY